MVGGVSGGISRAVDSLLEMQVDVVQIVGLSIGGIIGWKAALHGLQNERLICISATRLRYEIERPETDILLLFGENDKYSPPSTWANGLDIQPQIIPGKGHEIYHDAALIKQIVCTKED